MIMAELSRIFPMHEALNVIMHLSFASVFRYHLAKGDT